MCKDSFSPQLVYYSNWKFVSRSGKLLVVLFILLSFSVRSQDFYWRGGSGKWSDPNNWQSSSGSLPTSSDNVIFDAESFSTNGQKVIIDKVALCKSMDWSEVDQKPVLSGVANLTIYGGLSLPQEMTIQYSGNIYFRAKNGQNNIDFQGLQMKSELIFDGNGQWNFLSPIDVGSANVQFIKGVIDTKGKKLSCGSFISTGEENRKIKLNSSEIEITAFNGKWLVNNQLNIEKGSAQIVFKNPNPQSESIFNGGSLSYPNVEFSNSVIVLGNNTFNSLKLNAGITCQFESGKTQEIATSLSARGCAGLIQIQATDNELAFLKKPPGDIHLSFVSLKYIEAIGPQGGFNASYSVDNGNNQNCNISETPREMRWKNGTGMWSDTLHWMSSGTGNNSQCVPLPYDNIVFDGNSFSGTDTIVLDMAHSFCNDLIWTSNQSSVLTNLYDTSDLTVYGSLEFAPQMKNNYIGDILFRNPSGNKFIKTNGVSFLGDVTFKGENGQWDLQSGIQVDGIIDFRSGTLNSNSHNIKCSAFLSDSANSRTLNLSSSTLRIMNTVTEPGLCLNSENLNFKQTGLKIEMDAEKSIFKAYGGDTIQFNQLSFINDQSSVLLRNDSTYLIFQKVSFAGNGTIYGSNMFDTLSFSKACVYSLQSGRTQTINNDIIAPLSCEGTLLLKSVSSGVQARILKIGDTLRVEHMSLLDINAIGSAGYTAENAVDLGNNAGWITISGAPSRELYWVGGSGDWNDGGHWALSSNGSGGECVPTPQDIVKFDQNSFQNRGDQVTVNLRNAFAADLLWSGNVDFPEFVSDEFTDLWIFGSLDLAPNLDFAFQGPVHFESTEPGKTIRTNGVKLNNINNNVYFNGYEGEWTLLDGLNLGDSDTSRNYLYFIRGSLVTNSQPVNCFYFYTPYATERVLSLGNSEIFVGQWYLDGRNMDMKENTSHIQIGFAHFYQRNTSNIKYHDLSFTSDDREQSLFVNSTDTVQFHTINFKNGSLSGKDSYVISESVHFSEGGAINIWDSTGMNVYKIGQLHFESYGEVIGNDTIGSIHFGASGLIQGNGEYNAVNFANDGDILGSNTFGSLNFSSGYLYQLEGDKRQTITDEFNIVGNNCESIWMQSTNGEQAEIFKSTNAVFGDFIEMSNIKASGGAVFDAGYFSSDLNNSNTGWVFHDNPLRFQLDTISTGIGDTLFICASNFNVSSDVNYLWQKYPGGDTVSTEYCLVLPPYSTGYYTLSVYYNDGDEGCVKRDTLLWGCFYTSDVRESAPSCYGYNDGFLELDVLEGTGSEPYQVSWYENDQLLASSARVDSLKKGTYNYIITDADGCTASGSETIDEPDPMELEFNVDYDLNTIEVEVAGGVDPIAYLWESGALDYITDIDEVGQYTVYVVDGNNCKQTASVTVDNRFKVLAPNAFTPNGDGLNDYFELYWQGPEIINYQLDIFGRWGNQIFTSNNFDELWNGKLFNNGDLQPTGVYSWRLVVTSYEGKQIVSQGTVTLLR